MYSHIDLHTHSSASDGTLSPADLVRRAVAQGIRVLALTDHDTLDGIAEAREAAAGLDLLLIPGVEVSVSWGGRTVHILGLGVAEEDAVLLGGLEGIRAHREWRAREIGRRLARHGIEDAYEGARALSGGRLIGRTHFARLLVERGRAKRVRDVFKHYLVTGRPGHVAGEWASLEDAVGWIRRSGGQAVIAHPARYRLTRTRMLRLIGELRELGGVGIEVVSGSHSRDDSLTFARHAREQGLLASAGSDYHGPECPWIELGRLPPLPGGCRPIWHDWPLGDAALTSRTAAA